MRNNHLWQWALTFGGSLAFCGVLAAQSPTSSTPQGAGQRGMATTQQGAMSATGCLQRGDASMSSPGSSAPGAAAGAGASASGSTGTFVLKNARMGGASSTSTSTSSDSPQASSSSSAASPAGTPAS